jgi:hypothetical protein
LDVIAQNTIATVEYEEFITRPGRGNTEASKTVDIELHAKEGFSWHIERVAITCSEGGSVAVYVGTIAPENLVDVMSGPISATRGRYFVPRGQRLVFHFYEQAEKQECTVNIQAEQLVPAAPVRRTSPGPGNDGGIDIVNVRDEVPSGNPLYDGARVP